MDRPSVGWSAVMGTCCDPRGYRRMFGQGTARRNADAYRRKGIGGSAKRLLGWLRERGVSGLTVLEIGGGVGAIQVELLRAGAARATNVELSPEYEEEAAALAGESGMAERVERRVGDFADLAAGVGDADLVVMHRVVCCYPDLERLLGPAADRARAALALTYPRATWPVRLGMRMGNLWFRLTRCSFRAFVHAPERMTRIVAARGMKRTRRHAGLLWESVLFERAPAGPPIPSA